jgi:hypothetical protein
VFGLVFPPNYCAEDREVPPATSLSNRGLAAPDHCKLLLGGVAGARSNSTRACMVTVTSRRRRDLPTSGLIELVSPFATRQVTLPVALIRSLDGK